MRVTRKPNKQLNIRLRNELSNHLYNDVKSVTPGRNKKLKMLFEMMQAICENLKKN